MDAAQDCGIFDDRLFSEKPEAVTGRLRPKVLGIRHHQTLPWAYSLEKLHVAP